MNRGLRWTIGIVVAAGVAALLVWAFFEGRKELALEREREKPVKTPPRVSRGAEGPVVTLDKETQERGGIVAVPIAAAEMRPEVVAYGALEEDPSASFVVRAPVAGVLRDASSRTWPGVGETIPDGTSLAAVDPRLSVKEKSDVAGEAAAARSDEAAAQAALVSAQADHRAAQTAVATSSAALVRTKQLNAEGKLASDRAVQEAEAKLRDDEARRDGAAARVAAETEHQDAAHANRARLDAALATGGGGALSVPVVARDGGDVVEVLAHLGESVEQGAPLLRLVKFDRLVARAELSVGQVLAEIPASARVVVLGAEGKPLAAESVTPAPGGAGPRGQQFLVRVRGAGALRPGAAAAVHLATSGDARKGVLVLRSAVVRASGRTWAYVQLAQDRFARREVDVAHPLDAGYFVAELWKPGDRVVATGAQLLLSEEMKSQIQVGEAGE